MKVASGYNRNFDIETYNTDSTAVLFDVTDYFVSDNKARSFLALFCHVK
ncbi:MAG: DUF5117 domain-containing protein [Butyricimonas paravirosa]